jgi:PAS domain S-box-containing protein
MGAALLGLLRGVRPTPRDAAVEFLREGRWRCERGARAFCQGVIGLLCASAAVSYAAGEPAAVLLPLRAAGGGLLVCILASLRSAPGRRRARELALLIVVVTAVTMELLAAHTGGPASNQHERLNLVILGAAVFMSWERLWSGVAALLVLAVYLTGALFTDALRAGPEILQHAGLLVASGAGALAVSTVRERVRWREFSVRHALARATRDGLEQEQRYRSLVETAGSAIVVLAPDSRVLEFNPEAERIFGRTREDVLGRRYLDLFVPPEIWDEATAFVRRVLAGDPTPPTQGVVRRPDGSRRIVVWRNRRLTDAEGRPYALIAVGQDVTELIEAERAHRESEARYRAIVEDQMELVSRCTPDGVLTFVNDAFCRYFGERREAIIGRVWVPDIAPEHVRRARRHFAELGRDRPTATLELRVRGVDQEFRWQQWTNRAILDAEGRTVEFQSVGRDITLLKRAEEEVRTLNRELEGRVLARTSELAASEHRFRTIFECSPIPIVVADERGRFVSSNDAFRRLMGLAEEEVEASSFRDLTHPDDIAPTVQAARVLREGTETVVQLNKRYRRRDGLLVWARAAVAAVRLMPDQTLRLFAMIQDITDQKAEEALEGGEGRARELLGRRATLEDALTALLERVEQHEPEMLWTVLVAADGAAHLGCVAGAQLPGDCRRALAAGADTGWGQPWRRTLEAQELVVTVETEIEPTSPESRAACLAHGLRSCWSQAVRGPGGDPAGVLAVYLRTPRAPHATERRLIARAAHAVGRIIERHRSDERERQHQRELAHVGRLTLVGELMAGLAHQLHQPLAAIVGYAGACERRLQANAASRDQILYLLGRIRDVALDGGQTIKRVRSFVRKEEVTLERVDVNDLVRRAAELAEPEARRYGLNLQLDLGTSLPPVEVDGIQIEQVILHLVTNGLEAMVSGNGSERALTIQSRRQSNGEIGLTVRDTGPGFTSPVQERLFEPFFSTKATGLGLGLSISRSIVEAHGGRIWAAADPDGGAIFSFTLPPADAA